MLTPEELERAEGTFDVVTAIECVEHMIAPIEELKVMRRMLRPGGLLFLTTGDASHYRKRLLSWRYVVPEIHISFFEPETLAFALNAAGFEASYPGYGPGSRDIATYKILKNLHRSSTSPFDRIVVSSPVARLANRLYGVAAHPVGLVVAGSSSSGNG
jgi:SAM-dependent methyltransferase